MGCRRFIKKRACHLAAIPYPTPKRGFSLNAATSPFMISSRPVSILLSLSFCPRSISLVEYPKCLHEIIIGQLIGIHNGDTHQYQSRHNIKEKGVSFFAKLSTDKQIKEPESKNSGHHPSPGKGEQTSQYQHAQHNIIEPPERRNFSTLNFTQTNQ